MGTLLTPEIKAWIGKSEPPYREEISRRDIIKYAIATEQRQQKYLHGDEAPPMFVSSVFRGVMSLDRLAPDGTAVQVLQPDLPLKRVMAGGTDMRVYRPAKPGDVLLGSRTLVDIYEKSGSTGPLIFVVYELNVTTQAGEPVMTERTTRIMR